MKYQIEGQQVSKEEFFQKCAGMEVWADDNSDYDSYAENYRAHEILFTMPHDAVNGKYVDKRGNEVHAKLHLTEDVLNATCAGIVPADHWETTKDILWGTVYNYKIDHFGYTEELGYVRVFCE